MNHAAISTPSPQHLGRRDARTNRAGTWRRNVIRSLTPVGLVVFALLGAADGAGAGPSGTVKASIAKGTLTVTGTKGPDAITIRLQSGNPAILEVDVGADGTAEFRFGRERFTAVIVNGAGGNDTLRADPTSGTFTDTEATSLNGDGGNDTVLGANGHERLFGGADDDFLDGWFGNDLLDGGAGHDTFQWDPGDANETIVGGVGTDRLAFNGSGASESINVSAAAGHVRITRDVANVVLDLDQVEAIDTRHFGGSDTITIGDLTGTGVTLVRPDLALNGVDDLQPDRVAVGAGATISQDGVEATIAGLGAEVRVVNGAATDAIHVVGTTGADVAHIVGTTNADVISAYPEGTDAIVQGATAAMFIRLTGVEATDIDLIGGNDQFNSVGGLAAVTSLDVDGGDGTDTLGGSNGGDVLRGGEGDDFLDGWFGNDLLDGGAGDDTFQWDPGDSNETIVGGNGTDRLVFNGSGANENITVSADAGHARLTRDVANVVLDLVEVEMIDARQFGGSDTITVGDLNGTGVTLVRPDLGLNGADDLQPDRVVVGVAATISQDGVEVTIAGLGAEVRVVNGAPTDAIHVVGTTGADVAHIVGTTNADVISVNADGTDAVVQGATAAMYVRLSGLELTDVDLVGGNDQFSSVSDLASVTRLEVDGGDGNDTLGGSNGADVISGGEGDDFLDGWFGNDLLDGGAGDDTFQWDPGDSNETIVGGDGGDRFMFNGSGASENINASAAADHVRITRDVANIVLDLVGVETVDTRHFGGSDTITIGDLSGTGVTLVRPDLALNGAMDLQIDSIVVNGTAGDDALIVLDDGSAVVVQGLAATIRVVGADPTLDRLTVNGLDGSDGITSTPGAAALMLLDLLP